MTQNKCIRFCLQKHSRSHIEVEDFIEINWLPVAIRATQMILCNVFHFFKKTCPIFIAKLFFLADHNSRNTRSSSLRLIQPKRKTNAGLNSLSYAGPSYWNKLPFDLKIPMTLSSFKHSIKKHFFEQMKIGKDSLFSY